MKNVNQKIIAEQLELSRATVSRALRNHPAISAGTRSRVMKLAAELDYSAQYVHRGRKKLRTEKLRLAVLIADQTEIVEESLTSAMLKGITEVIDAANGISSVHFIDSESSVLPAPLRSDEVDGLVLIHRFPEELVSELAEKWPCVSLNYTYDNPELDSVDADDMEAFAKIIGYLRECGHQRVGYVGVESPHPRLYSRFAAYMRGLAFANLEYDPAISFIDGETYPDSESKAEEVLKAMDENVSAWVCGNDFVAEKLIRFLNSKGIRVPDDISVTGFAAVVSLPDGLELCTCKAPFEEIGREGALQLLERIKKPLRTARHVKLSSKFIPGNSVSKID